MATDLDGTLLRSDRTVSGRTRAAPAAALRAGLPVVAAVRAGLVGHERRELSELEELLA